MENSCNELTTLLGNSYNCKVVSPTKIRVSGFSNLAVGAII